MSSVPGPRLSQSRFPDGVRAHPAGEEFRGEEQTDQTTAMTGYRPDSDSFSGIFHTTSSSHCPRWLRRRRGGRPKRGFPVRVMAPWHRTISSGLEHASRPARSAARDAIAKNSTRGADRSTLPLLFRLPSFGPRASAAQVAWLITPSGWPSRVSPTARLGDAIT